MAQNYILLERIELNASAASVTFSNIPQSGYTDLKIVMSVRDTEASVNNAGIIQFNGETATTNYSARWLYGTGSTAASLTRSGSGAQFFYESNSANSTSNTFANIEFYIPNYLSSSAKSVSVDVATETNATNTDAILTAGLWNNTAAINSILLKPNGGVSFVANSTFSLYGLAAVGTTPVIAPKASGGNITTDGTYWIHTFLTSGTFTPATNLTCDYLVVAGGGGGGVQTIGTSYGQGGGGGGGLRCTVGATGGGGSLESPLSLTTTAYTVTVGSGGASNTSGNNSVFSTITSIGGGRGGNGSVGYSSQVGGSGGGAGAWSTQYNGSAGTANQGYAGGNNAGNNIDGAGGGGGAGQVGYNGVSGTSGQGGNGVQTSISGTATYYAGGGGGGGGQSGTLTSIPGGLGGGGNGGGNTTAATSATAGTINTGGGGGGSGRNTGGGSPGSPYGGSGIVIIRYPIA